MTAPTSDRPVKPPVPAKLVEAQLCLNQASSAEDFDHIHALLRPRARPGDGAGACLPHSPISKQDLNRLLTKIALRRDADAEVVTLEDVKILFGFFMSPMPDMKPDDKASQELFCQVLSTPVPAGRSARIMSGIQSMLDDCHDAGGFNRLIYPMSFQRARMSDLLQGLIGACKTPGQTEAITAAALDLAQQLSDPERKTTTALLLHGRHADGLEDLARDLAAGLASQGFTDVLHLDCSIHKTANDKAWLGHDPVWVGSAPGTLTEFIWRHPKCVVVFHRADESRSEVLTQLQGALMRGALVDEYGLPAVERSKMRGSGKTLVDTSQAVFIFTASHSSEWLAHPDASAVLGEGAQRKATLIKALKDARFTHGRDESPSFDTQVLAALTQHHHVLRALSWPVLRGIAVSELAHVLQYFARKFGVALQWQGEDEALAALAESALASWGADMGLHSTAADALSQVLLQPAAQRLLAQSPSLQALHVSVSPSFTHQWGLLRARWGDDIWAGCQRYQEMAHLTYTLVPGEGLAGVGAVRFDGVHAQAVRPLSDFVGKVALVSKVPEVTLDDVAGHDEVKGFLEEMIGLLKHPGALQRLGVSTPRGVLLHGAPGTGKTLLAKALAGQAGLPFVSVAGPELLNLENLQRVFSLVRSTPAVVVHIDEADVLGKRGVSAGHDIAINTLLAQLDGFHAIGQAFFILTTNKSPEDAFDDALLRPGRIDRSFEVRPLSLRDREHKLAKVWGWMNPTVADKARVLKLTHGMSGAQLMGVEQALAMRMVRQGQGMVPPDWVFAEIDAHRWGPNSATVTPLLRRRMAVHEAGHAIAHQLLMSDVAPIGMVCVGAHGYVSLDRTNQGQIAETAAAVRNYMAVLLAGRAAELLVFGDDAPSNGAASDLARASAAGYKAVAFGGLDPAFGLLSLNGIDGAARFVSVSQDLHKEVADRVRHWLNQAHHQATDLLLSHRAALDTLTEELVAEGVVDQCDIVAVLQPRASKPTTGARRGPIVESEVVA